MTEIRFLGFPVLYDQLEGESIQIDFVGRTLEDLIRDLLSRHGESIREALWDMAIDGLDPSIQIAVNGKFVEARNANNIEVDKGDQITFMRLLAGG